MKELKYELLRMISEYIEFELNNINNSNFLIRIYDDYL